MSIITDTFNRLQAYRHNKFSSEFTSSEFLPDSQHKKSTWSQFTSSPWAKLLIVSLGIFLILLVMALGTFPLGKSFVLEVSQSTKPLQEPRSILAIPASDTKPSPSTIEEQASAFTPPVDSIPENKHSLSRKKFQQNESPRLSSNSTTAKSDNASKKIDLTVSEKNLTRKETEVTPAEKPALTTQTKTRQLPSTGSFSIEKKGTPNAIQRVEDYKNRGFPLTTANSIQQPVFMSYEQRLTTAQSFIHKQSYEQAIKVLEPIFKSPPKGWKPWFLMGTAELGLEHLDRAEAFIMEGLVRDEAVPYLWIQRALVNQQRGQYGKATDALSQAAFLAPDLPEVQLNLGYTLEIQGSARSAIEHYRRYLLLTDGETEYFATRKKVLERVARLERS